jgi:protein subunit release factor A
VWDREKRVDHVFSNEGIEQVMENYDEWKRKRDEVEHWDRQRQAEVSDRLRKILGLEAFGKLQKLSSSLVSATTDETISTKIEVENYVQAGVELFQQVRDDPSASLDPSSIPMSDYEALDTFSELVALLPDSLLRPMILSELSLAMNRAKGNKINVSSQRELPVLLDEDLTETFIRGSGPGGQKVNKTSNRVLLVHGPTQLRVECQDTRSLQQNRKIARKRLQQKIDDFLHGSQSKASLAADKAATKKFKAKVRSRARQRQKKEEGEQKTKPSSEETY